MESIEKLYDKNYLEYASYVIKDRAIPHIKDGLKPVQRRIMHSLLEMDDGKYHKVANVTGHCMKYHPHGDASINSALVNIANKEIFIDKQGNYGNIYTGDPASAARYIECKVTDLGKELIYNPKITEYQDSYDGRNKEPIAFPSKVPVLLSMGTEGIAVGMSTKILPHNFIEVIEAQIKALRGRKFELLPDFITGGSLDASEYEDGNGKVLSRACLDTSDPKKIIITQLPFGMTTETLISSIESAAKKNKIKVSSINDYTAEKVEVEIKLMRGVNAKDVISGLYAFTDCEVSLSPNIIVIKDDKPVQMTVTEIIKYSATQLTDILTAELNFEAKALNEKLHAKTLEQIFIENRIYKKIETMKTAEDVVKAVHLGLKPYQSKLMREVSDDDVDMLLRIPIRRISLYDINKAQKEMAEIKGRLKEIKALLADIVNYAVAYLRDLIKKHKKNYPRLSKIDSFRQVSVREVAKRDQNLRYDKNTGYIGLISTGDLIAQVSHYDKILVIKKDASYSVVDVPEKLFVDKGVLYCGFLAPKMTFNIVYKNKKTGHAYIKRCNIEKFILNKTYELVPEGCSVLSFNTGDNYKIELTYKPKPKQKVKEESFSLSDFPHRGVKAGGLKLSNKDVKSAKFKKS